MSIITMFRVCPYCRRRFTFNPSVGRFGMICPKCSRYIRQPQAETPSDSNNTEENH